MEYKNVISEVSKSLGLTDSFVDKVYKAYWRTVREHIIALPLKDDLSDEEFLKLQPNVNIPSLGKFYVDLNYYHRVKKLHKNTQNKNN